MLLAALTIGSIFAFLIFTAILCLVGWGVTRIPMPDWMRIIIWVVVGVFFLLMIYELLVGGHAPTLVR